MATGQVNVLFYRRESPQLKPYSSIFRGLTHCKTNTTLNSESGVKSFTRVNLEGICWRKIRYDLNNKGPPFEMLGKISKYG